MLPLAAWRQDLVLGSPIEIATREKPRHQKKLMQLLELADESQATGGGAQKRRCCEVVGAIDGSARVVVGLDAAASISDGRGSA